MNDEESRLCEMQSTLTNRNAKSSLHTTKICRRKINTFTNSILKINLCVYEKCKNTYKQILRLCSNINNK